MAVIRRSQSWTSQPQGPAEIDWQSPLARDLLAVQHMGGLVWLKPSGVTPITLSGVVADIEPNSVGVHRRHTAWFGYTISNTEENSINGYSGPATLLSVYVPGPNSNTTQISQFGSGFGHIISSADGAPGKVTAKFRNLTKIGGSFTMPTQGPVVVAIARSIPGVEQALWVNGQKDPITGSGTPGALGNRVMGVGANSPDGLLLNAYFKRALSDAEIAALSANPWQIFKPQTRRTVFALDSGPSPIPGNATGTPASLTLTPPAGTAAGKAQASGTPASLSLTAPTATVTVTPTASAGNAVGTPAPLALSAPSATAAGKAAASAAPASLSITAPTATAVGKAQATGATAALSITAPQASATGKAAATGTPAQITISAPTASAFGGAAGQAIGSPASLSIAAPQATASGSAVASAMYAGLSISAPTATASVTPASSAGNAVGTPAGISLSAPTATARGRAAASASPASISLSAPAATARGAAVATGGYAGISISAPTATASAADPRGFAVGSFAGLIISAPTAFARGEAAPDDGLIESQRYRQIALAIERGQIVNGPADHLFLKVGLRSKYRGM